MEKTATYYKEMAQRVRYGIEKESNILIDRLAQMDEYKEMAECVEELLAEVQRLKGENKEQSRKHGEEQEALRQQLADRSQQWAEEKERRQEMEMKLAEMSKLSTVMAKKASDEAVLMALRTYANASKRKTMDKRAFAKTSILEIANANGLTLPKEFAATIESLDDEQVEPKVVNVGNGGHYNDIHDNKEIKL